MAAAKLPGSSYLPLAEVAKLMGWETRRVRRWLAREGGMFKKGRYFYTTRDRMRAAFPEVWEEIALSLEE